MKSTDKLIERALNASVYAAADLSDTVASIKEQRASQRTGVYKHLMNGVSFMIPFVVAGGIAIALSFVFGYNAFEQEGTLAAYLMGMGGGAGAFGLMIPVLGSISTGLILFYLIGKPVAMINQGMNNFLTGMSGANAIILGLVLGLMMALDMGGPVNKAAYAFGTGTLVAGAGSSIMAAVMAAGMVPPLGLALATVLFKNKFTAAEREAGKAAWVLGASFITEGAIPFAAADPIRVIPSIMIGSAVTGALSMAFHATLSVPHGGIFVFFAVENWPLYILAIAIGTVATGLIIGTIKKKVEE